MNANVLLISKTPMDIGKIIKHTIVAHKPNLLDPELNVVSTLHHIELDNW